MAASTEALLANTYDVASIPPLENYLNQQVSSNTYDFVANKALLKLYDLHPDKRDDNITALILAKALMALPSTDMMLSLYLVPEDVRARAPVSELVVYGELLETAKFAEFWEMAKLGSNPLLDGIVGFDTAIRSYMVGVFAKTYQKTESIVFMENLALGDTHLAPYVSQHPDSIRLEGRDVIFLSNDDNQQRAKQFKENISFEKILPIIDAFSASS